MLNVLEADTKDFQKVVNNILIEVKPLRLRGKISDDFLGYVNELRQTIINIEAKLAESEKELEDKNKLIIQEDGECLLCGDGYCINNDVAKIIEENKKLKKQLELLDYEKTIKHYSLNRDLDNPESEEMQKHLNRYVFKDKFRICCSMCGKTHEYEFKDIKYSDLFNDIYISCKSCPRSLNKLNFPEQAIAFYRTRYDLVCYEKHQDYLFHRNHISAFEDEINQLKQQIEETEELNKKFEEHSQAVDKALDDSCDVIRTLKQQLAEKDGELHQIYSNLGVEAFGEDIHEQALKEIANREKKLELRKSLCRVCQSIDNKTAIAELQKVLEWLNIPFDENGCLKNGEDLENYINQQIKELKGDKNG